MAKKRSGTVIQSRQNGGFFAWLRGKIRRWWPRMLVLGVGLWLVMWLWAGGVFAAAVTGVSNAMVHAMANKGFVVERLEVSGRHYTNVENLKQALSIDIGTPLFAADLRGAQQRVQELDWVENVMLRRHWPDRISVTLTERQPLAIWMRGQGQEPLLLDRSGTAMVVAMRPEFAGLLRVSGGDAPMALPEFMPLLIAEPELAPYIKQAKRIGDRRWDIQLESGGWVKLPEDDAGFALSRLAAMHKEKGILDKNVSEIDLRLHDRMIIDNDSDSE